MVKMGERLWQRTSHLLFTDPVSSCWPNNKTKWWDAKLYTNQPKSFIGAFISFPTKQSKKQWLSTLCLLLWRMQALQGQRNTSYRNWRSLTIPTPWPLQCIASQSVYRRKRITQPPGTSSQQWQREAGQTQSLIRITQISFKLGIHIRNVLLPSLLSCAQYCLDRFLFFRGKWLLPVDDWPEPGQSEERQRHYSGQHVLCPSSCSETWEKPVGRQNSLLVNHPGKLFGRLQIVSGTKHPEIGLFHCSNMLFLGYPQCSGSSWRILAVEICQFRCERIGGVLRRRKEWNCDAGTGKGGKQGGNKPKGAERLPQCFPPNDSLLISSFLWLLFQKLLGNNIWVQLTGNGNIKLKVRSISCLDNSWMK